MLAGFGEIGSGAKGRERCGGDGETREESGLGEGKSAGGFAKVLLGRGLDSVVGAAIGDVVEVELEDLVFGISGFDEECQGGLAELAPQSFLASKQGIFDELLGDGRATLEDETAR